MEIKLFHKIFKILFLIQSVCLRVLDTIVIVSSSNMLYNVEGSHTFEKIIC